MLYSPYFVNNVPFIHTERLSKHHAVIIAAMKAKQIADMKYAKNLKESIEALLSYYPEHNQ